MGLSGKDVVAKKGIAAALLADWMPYLTQGMCGRCGSSLQSRLQNLASSGKISGVVFLDHDAENSADFCSADSSLYTPEKSSTSSINSCEDNSQGNSNGTPYSNLSTMWRHNHNLPTTSSQHSVSKHSQHSLSKQSCGDDFTAISAEGNALAHDSNGFDLSKEEGEWIRFSQVGRKRDFALIERINGKPVDVLKGLELHTHVFNDIEQKKIVDYIYNLQQMGQKGLLRERTYSEPRKWMRGKGRVTIQFGCCYNYAMDKNGNPPGIIRDEDVDPLPPLFRTIIKRLVKWHVLPPTCIPNSCIVNIYDEGDCIPPHIDHHDFLRPFCTISFLTECNILFGSNLKILGPGEFSGPMSIALPVGSVLILNGNGADIAKHCVPGVPGKRISITFRKMDDSKLPYSFKSDPELQGLQPLSRGTPSKSLNQQAVQVTPPKGNHQKPGVSLSNLNLGVDDFPPLGGLSLGSKQRRR
ncbi:hypothetical protein ACLOJK_033138 [Asimina triloba]